MRYKHLDVAKGITLIFILMAHSCGFPFGLTGYCISYFVSLFFVVSGYLQKDVFVDREYICRRFRKIIVPYFTYNLLIWMIYIFWKGFENFEEVIWAIVGIFYSTYCLFFPIETENNIFFFRIENNPTWFLTAFFFANLFFGLYVRYCTKTIEKTIVFILFIVITQILYYCPVFFPWNIDKAFIGANFMIFGYELKKYNWMEKETKARKYIFLILLTILYKLLVDFNPGMSLATREYGCQGIYSAGLYLVTGIAGSLLCMWYSKLISEIPCVGTMFAIVGKESLVIMAMHLIIFRIFDQILQHRQPQQFGDFYYWFFSIFRIGVTCMIIIGVTYGIRYVRAGKTQEICRH